MEGGARRSVRASDELFWVTFDENTSKSEMLSMVTIEGDMAEVFCARCASKSEIAVKGFVASMNVRGDDVEKISFWWGKIDIKKTRGN